MRRSALHTILIAGLLLAPALADAQIGVSPPHLELALRDGAASGALRLFNLGKEAVEVTVEVFNWDLDEDNHVRILPPTEQSLDQWLILNPLRFTLKPGKSQVVRLAVRPRVAPAPGEHRAIVYFSETGSHEVERKEGTFKVAFRMGVAVYADAEPVVRHGVLHGVSVNNGEASFDISSDGNAHVRLSGQYAVWRAGAYPGAAATHAIAKLGTSEEVLPDGVAAAGPLPDTPVLPGARRRVTLQLSELPAGAYVLDVNGALAGTPVDLGEAFTAEAPTPDPTATPSVGRKPVAATPVAGR